MIKKRAKRSKYSAKRTRIGEITFASKGEAARYKDLVFLEHMGKIKNLTLQPRFPLDVYGKLICTYVADFQYEEEGQVIVEDFKGVRTRDYIIKQKMFKALYGDKFEHRETTKVTKWI